MTLTKPAPRTLGLLDQLGFLAGNLGVSLLGFTGALSSLTPLGPGRSVCRPRSPRSWSARRSAG
jgi:hypothetical protein